MTAAVAMLAYRIDAALGERAALALMVGVPACGLGAMAIVTVPAGAMLILSRGLLDALWMPLVNAYLNRLVDSHLRATMLSLQGVVTARLGLSAPLGIVAVAVTLHRSAPAAGRPARGGEARRQHARETSAAVTLRRGARAATGDACPPCGFA